MGFIGSGRHRRPTQTERAVAAAGVAGAGIAIPLLTATGAHAVAPTTWDAVAQCASAGNWAKDTGNGAYGGLQIDLHSWVAYGGDAYAAEPDHATRDQQIAVAERILADRGAANWGSCATSAGLTGEGRATTQPTTPAATTPAAPTTAPAAPATTDPAAPVQRGSAAPVFPGMQGRDASGLYWYQAADGGWYWTTSQQVYEQATGTGQSAAPTGTPTQDGQAPTSTTGTPTAPTTTPATPAPGTTTAPGVPGTATATPPAPGTPGTPGVADPTGQAGTPAGDPGTLGTPAAPATTGTPAPAATPAPTTYTVTEGDTLSGISDTHKLGGWKHLYDQNQSTVGEDPDMIHPGQVLEIH
ncbi:transglycosylase family protein [Kitasatospora sp. NPDC059571]|uniref:LysM peptidoglycan-binding domain-containing protein n=1 Tax=Kitasatospora sp. NPDC059571 TaxID=3346871 RepID=UPI0036A54B51